MGTLTGAVVSSITSGSISPIAPDAVSGLTLWLLADSIVGSADLDFPTDVYADVGGWDFQQGNSSSRAQYHASGTGGPNGHAWLHFDGTDDFYRTTAQATSGTTPFGNATTQFWVVHPESAAGHAVLYSWLDPADNAGNMTMMYAPIRGTPEQFTYTVGDSAGSGSLSAVVPSGWNGNWHIVEVHRSPVASGGAGQILVDGAVVGSGTFTDDLAPTFTEYIMLMAYNGGFGFFAGGLAEWCNYSRDLTSSERSSVRLGLKAKYGIA